MKDQHLAFLDKFIELYLEMIHHDGYGDMEVHVRTMQKGKKEVRLLGGREFTYVVDADLGNTSAREYRVMMVRNVRGGGK